MTISANITYALLFLTTTAYALLLERFRSDAEHHYAPRWTWVTVVVGVAIVGLYVAWHGAIFVPWGSPEAVFWWAWWVMFYHFVAGGLPIIVWQVVVDRRDIERALRASMARRKG